MANIPLGVYYMQGNFAGETNGYHFITAPTYNTPYGYQQADLNFVKQNATADQQTRLINAANSEQGANVSSLEQLFGAPTQFLVDPNTGAMTTQAALDQANTQASDPNMVNIGTVQAPLYVPKGSPGDLLSTNLASGAVSPTNPTQEFAASAPGILPNVPNIVPNAPTPPPVPTPSYVPPVITPPTPTAPTPTTPPALPPNPYGEPGSGIPNTPVPTPIPVFTPPVPTTSQITIQPGDTLTKIANQNNTTVNALVAENKIVDPNKIIAGATLSIPVSSPAAIPTPTPATVLVKPGDTLTKIAAQNDTTVQAIVQANNIADPNKIQAGAVLRLPPISTLSPTFSSPNLTGNSSANPISSASLAPSPTINPAIPTYTPTPDISNLNPPVLQPTAQENQAQGLIGNIQNLNDTLSGKAAYQSQQETAAGIPELQKTQNDLTAQLNHLKAKAAAIPIDLQNQAAGRGITTAILGRQQEKLLQDNAVEALGISAMLSASQGNIALANDQVKRAVDTKYGPIEAEIAAKKANLDLIINSPDYTRAEKNRALAQQAIQDAQTAKVAQAKTDSQHIYEIALEAAKNGASALTLQKIQSSSTPAQALQTAGSSLKSVSTSASVPGTPAYESAIVSKFTTALANRAALDTAGTREQFIRQLQAQFPTIDANDIASYVYTTYPDNYENVGGSQGVDYYVQQIKSGAIDISGVPSNVRSAVAAKL